MKRKPACRNSSRGGAGREYSDYEARSAGGAAGPRETEDKPDPRGAMRRIRELRKGVTLGSELTIRDLIEEGRRF